MSARILLAALGALAVILVRVPAAAAPGEMVSLPGGTFRAGEPTGPRRDITYHRVRPFLLDATEVTVAAYAECVRAGKCKAASGTVEWDAVRDRDRKEWSPYCNQDRADRSDHPVNCVEWNDAAAYCAWAGKRLPTEAEWEWAARNGKARTRYPWGDDPPGSRACWSGDGNDAGTRGRGGTCPAASHAAGDSRSGVKDLAGNVMEWTSSRDVVAADSRGRGGTPAKVARGGSWREADPTSLSAVARLLDLPSRRSPDLGFRCAKSP